MRIMKIRRWVGLCIVTYTLLPTACMTEAEWHRFWTRGRDEQPDAQPRPLSDEIALRDTIATLVTIQGMRMNQVRGFGLVLDLVDTGGRDGPDVVRKHLIKEIQRRQDVAQPGFSPLEMLNTRDSTMVELTGFVPAGAEKGDRFDIILHTLGSEATSLVGGRLVLGDLKIYAETASGVLSGKTLATAEGPVFVSPFNRRGEPTDKVELRRGVVLGGGVVKQDRKVRLVLNAPSPSNAKRIELRLNSRYAGDEPIVVGQSAAFLELSIPPGERTRIRVFLERLLHTTLNSNPTFLGRRTRELLRGLREDGADYNAIGVALEANGKTVLPSLRSLYEDDAPEVSYFAARTGLRLEDRESLAIVAKHANDTKSPFRREAIDELGWATNSYGAGEQLRKLLDDPADRIRIAAYKALRRRPHPAIERKVLDQDNLILDLISSKGPYLIYVQRLNTPRIALFGRNMKLRPPLMFPGHRSDGRRLVTQLSASGDDRHLSFVYLNKRSGRVSPKIAAPIELAGLIEFLGDAPRKSDEEKRLGFAVPFSEIVDILSTFCETKSLSANFVLEGLEDVDAADDERPESEF